MIWAISEIFFSKRYKFCRIKINSIKLLEPLEYIEINEEESSNEINLDIPLTITNDDSNNQTTLEL